MLDSGLFKPPAPVTEQSEDKIELNAPEPETDDETAEEAELLANPAPEDSHGEDDYDDDSEHGYAKPSDHEDIAPPKQEYDPDTQKLIEQASFARDQYSTAERELRDLEREIQNIQDALEKDFGPEEEFGALNGECFSYEDREYVYKLCPFDKVTQAPKHGGSETRLGSWVGWRGGEYNQYNQYDVMMCPKSMSPGLP